MLAGCTPWPCEAAASYRAAGYWDGEVLGDLLRPWARSDPMRVAVVSDDRRVTYRELDESADRLATGMARLGIKALDRVVVQLPNVPEFITVAVALFRLGALPVFALPAYRRYEIEYLCEHTQAVAYIIRDRHLGFDYRILARQIRPTVTSVKHILVSGDGAEFQSLAPLACDPDMHEPPASDEVAFFLLSGGTTGSPKLIPRTHNDYAYQLRASAAGLKCDHGSVYLAALPIGHNAGLGCPGVLGTLRLGGKVVLATSPSPGDVFPLIQREGVTLTTLITPLVNLWMEAARSCHVRFPDLLLQVGGAMLDEDLGRRIPSTLGCRLTHWFGMAEGFLSYTRTDDDPEVIVKTQGRPLCPADELRLVDADDHDVDAGAVGELLVRGPYTTRGYYQADDYNRSAFTSDGYLRTGDLVSIDHDGNMVVTGRRKEVINRAGEKVSPEELEWHLATHPDVSEVAVIPVADAAIGHGICACLAVRGAGLSLDAVRSFLRAKGLADFKLPDSIRMVDRLPRTSIGKVDRRALRESA